MAKYNSNKLSRCKHISEFLREIPQESAPFHPLKEYAKAFVYSKFKAKKFLGSGTECVAVELESSRVLKISKSPFSMKQRPFDLDVFGKGCCYADRDGLKSQVFYIIQPKVKMCATEEDLSIFERDIKLEGYRFRDKGTSQLGFYHGRLVLVDPYSVGKIS